MATLAELLVRLEKRVMTLEMLAGITPDKELLMHPKSFKQAEAKAERVRIEADRLKEKREGPK